MKANFVYFFLPFSSAFKNVGIKKAQHLSLLHLGAPKSPRTQVLHETRRVFIPVPLTLPVFHKHCALSQS